MQRTSPDGTDGDFNTGSLDICLGSPQLRRAAARQRLELLGALQERADTVIRTPDFTQVPNEQIWAWHVAATLLRGETLIGTIPEGHGLDIELESEVNVDDTLVVRLPHTVKVAEQTVDVGYYEVVLETPMFVDRSVSEKGFLHVFTTTDKTFTQRQGSPQD